MSEEDAAVDLEVLQVARAEVPLGVWLMEVVNMLASVERVPTRRAIEGSVNRLAAAGLVVASSHHRPELTGEGRRAVKRLGRFQSAAKANSWLTDELSRHAADAAMTVWRLPAATWKDAVEASRAHQRGNLLARKEIVDGLLKAIAQLDKINTVVRECRDRPEAREAVIALGYTAIQAEHILEASVSNQTKEAIEQLRAEKARIEALIGQLGRG